MKGQAGLKIPGKTQNLTSHSYNIRFLIPCLEKGGREDTTGRERGEGNLVPGIGGGVEEVVVAEDELLVLLRVGQVGRQLLIRGRQAHVLPALVLPAVSSKFTLTLAIFVASLIVH